MKVLTVLIILLFVLGIGLVYHNYKSLPKTDNSIFYYNWSKPVYEQIKPLFYKTDFNLLNLKHNRTYQTSKK